MIKLDSICDKLESIKERLEEKINSIEGNAFERDRDLTDKEEERIEEMNGEIDAIENALDYLRDYCECY